MSESANEPQGQAAAGAAAGGGQRQQVRVHMDEREMSTSYANSFRTNATGDEVFVDFGLNMVVPAQGDQGNQPAGQLMLKFNDRVILNYKTAKRLAITLGQLVRAHEERFGEISLEQSGGGDAPASGK
jgi:hypothetical protein